MTQLTREKNDEKSSSETCVKTTGGRAIQTLYLEKTNVFRGTRYVAP